MVVVQVAAVSEPVTYFETLASAVQDHYHHHARQLNAKGFLADDEHMDNLGLDWQGMGRGVSQTRTYRFFMAKVDKRGSSYEVERYLHITLYRLDSGRYEALAYVL